MSDGKAISIAAGRRAMALARDEWGLRPLAGYLTALVSDPDVRCKVAGNWYVVSIEHQHANLARGEITKRGLVPYLPLIPNRERHGRGAMRTVYRPMLGPYMLVKCRRSADDWGLIKSSRGVRRLLGCKGQDDGHPVQIADGEVEVIRLYEAEQVEKEQHRSVIEEAAAKAREGGKSGIIWHFSPGDRVRIKNGPFAAFYAQLEAAVDDHDRIKAVVNLFGRQSVVELSAFDIEAL